ncbi:MAG: molybdopterin oxidoreductase family protein, partial [Anaerolineae bacterium]|nr:molybdopterin oxidoreductase family protein [Anaerolineae bacterium]
MAQTGLDPLPGWEERTEDFDPPAEPPASGPLDLVSAAAHHFVTSSMANQEALLAREGTPFLEMHPTDAAERGISEGQVVIIENGRGWCKLRAVISEAVRPGVVASPKGFWSRRDPFANG